MQVTKSHAVRGFHMKLSRLVVFRLAMLLACGCHGGEQAEAVNSTWSALSGEDGGLGDAGSGDAGTGGALEPPVPDAGDPPACVPSGSDDSCNHLDEDCDGNVDEGCPYSAFHCPAGTVIIEGSDGDDWLLGTPEDDCIVGYGGHDELWGMLGNDTLFGGPGHDSLQGLAGDDTLLAGDGDDQLYGGAGIDRLEGEAGNDFLEGGEGEDALAGGACNDRLLDASGPDQLAGGPGHDRIVHGQLLTAIGSGNDGFDACDGSECELPQNSFSCRDDGDCAAGERCSAGSRICVPEAVLFDGACDGVDDDCDGQNDEDYAPVTTSCGVGMCAATGATACQAGAVSDSCTPGNPAASDDSCNDQDDDCDGQSDEGYASTPTSCGVGACASSGATACVAGAVTDSCSPGTPAASDESCNGSDDDCDGQSDEAYAPVATSCGVGMCASAGVTSCGAGSVQDSCVPGAPAADDASCDGLDQDCDGASDEDYAAVATSCGIGACASTGVTSCTAGSVQDGCTPGTPAASDASCDGIDDDCNGASDEDYAPVATSCGIGACASTGVTSCTAGSVQDGCTPGTPAASDASCDGVDDDCSGASDEDYAPQATSCEVGGCLATGATSCAAGSVLDSCPTAPVCIAELACGDDSDNDGDARIDCDDVDCVPSPDCAPQPLSVNVLGNSNIWGAGHASVVGDGGLPPVIALTYGAGSILTFASVTGTVTASGSLGPLPADGTGGTHNIPSAAGIAGYTHLNMTRSMVGVFLGPDEPSDPAPARLTFPDGNFTSLSPLVEQMFFIGDGRTADGTVQQFIVPPGATRLALGTYDLCPGVFPGCFSDNSGAYLATGQVAPAPPTP